MAQSGGGEAKRDRLKSWKEIASFFGTDERTVKRWEHQRGLPVHRLPGTTKATVFAETGELEQWLNRGREPAEPAPYVRRRSLAYAAFGAIVLTGAVGAALTFRAPAAPNHHQPSQAVAELYLAGRYNFERRVPASLNRAVQLFSEAIRRDPDYAEAYAGLADCHLLLREYAGVPDSIAYPRARAAAERALALDGSLAEAHAALAFVTFFYDHDFDRGLEGFRRAIALDPESAGAHHWYATALFHAARVEEALTQIDAAQRLEPQSQSILADKALILSAAGQDAQAVSLLRQMEADDPDYLSPHAYLAQIHLRRGDYPAYLAEARSAATLSGNADYQSVIAEAERGYRIGGATGMFVGMIARQHALYAAGRGHAFDLAGTYALAGRRADAMRMLEDAIRDHDPYLVALRIDFRFASLRAAPDFQRLALSVGGG